MGGMYNVLFDENPNANIILHALRLDRKDFGRFRDALVANGEIAVYTRCGGGNREAYQTVFDQMKQHPFFLREQDDSFDGTYCTFFFRIPGPWSEQMKVWDIGAPWNPDDRWKAALSQVGKRDPDELRKRMNKHMTAKQVGGSAMGAGDFLDNLKDEK